MQRRLNSLLALRQTEVHQDLLQELISEVQRRQTPNVIGAFKECITKLGELVTEAETTIEDAKKQTILRLTHLFEEKSLKCQLDQALERIKELGNENTRLRQELANKEALLEAESDREASERVGIQSPRELTLTKEVEGLVFKLEQEIRPKIDDKNKEIDMFTGKIAANGDDDDSKWYRDEALPRCERALEKLKKDRELARRELQQKQDELVAIRTCPICIRRFSSESTSSEGTVDSGIGMSSVES